MATRDLRFNIFANDRASAAFARISAAAEALASTITRIDGRRARIRVEADTTEAEAKLARAEAKLDALNRRRASPTIDADIKLLEAKIAKAHKDLEDLSNEEATPEVRVAIAKAEADILKFKEKIEELNREKASPRVEADIAQAEAEVARLREELDYLQRNGVEIPVDADTRRLDAKLAKAQERLAELQRYRPSVEVDADIREAERKIEQLQDELRILSAQKTDVDIDAETATANQKLEALNRQLESLGNQTQTPLIRLHTGQVEAEIAQVRAQLDELERQRQIRINIAGGQAEIAALRAQIVELGKMRATPRIDAEIARAEAKIALIQLQLQSIKDRTISVRIRDSINRGAGSALGYLNDLRRAFQNNINSAAQLIRNLRQLALPASFAGLLPMLASLGASFREMAGAISLLPAAAGFAAAAIGTLAIGFSGLTDAIGPRDTGAQIKKADLAMSRLGDTAKELARTIIGLKDDWNGLKQAVQNALFADIVPVFRNLAERYIPVLKDGLSGMATEFNGVARQLALFLGSADTIDQTNALFEMFGMTVKAMGPGFVDATKAFMNLAEVGASFLPVLGQGFSNLMARFSEFIETAKNDGSMRLWMAKSIVAIEEFGDLLGNIGGMFGAIFDAAQKSGASFVETLTALTGELEDFLRSGEGQAGLVALFQGIREAIDAMLPGIRSFLNAVAEGIGELQPAFGALGVAFTSFSDALSPAIVMLSGLATDVIVPLSAAFSFLMDTIAPIAPMLVTIAVGIKAFAALGAVMVTAGAAISGAATAIGLGALAMTGWNGASTRLADGMTKLGNAIQRVGNSLPLIGAALIAGWMAWDTSRSKADEYATAVTRGAMTINEAIQEEINQLENRDFWWGATGDDTIDTQNRLAEATGNITRELRDQLAAMDPLERAQTELNIAEANYSDILARLGPQHTETKAALSILVGARERLSTATAENARTTETATEALIRNTQEVQNAANADSALERANLRLEEQQIRTTEVLRDHTAGSIEGRTAILDLKDAALAAAEAAGRKAQADAEANDVQGAAAIGARAYEERLIELASTARGPLREALLQSVANLESTKNGSNDAALAAVGLKDDVEAIPVTQVTTYSTPGLAAAITGLQNLTVAVGNLKDKSFKIRADGEVVGVGMTGLATGGVMPGYTPGRDVHLAALSGGEAVMRPEWTRAVGVDYIYAGNAVARAGGVGAVRQWMAAGSPTGGRGAGPQQLHEYAAGGVAARSVMGNVEYSWPKPTVTDWYDHVVSTFQKNVEKAAKLLAATNAMGAGGGGSGWAWQMNVLRQRFPGLALISGFRPGAITATGNRSYHAQGRAVDVPPRMDVFNWIKGTYGANTKELIYSPANNGQVHNGRNHYYGEPTRGDHWDHVHWAFDKGGEAEGSGLMFKDVIKPERILDPKMTQVFNRLVETLRGGGMSALPYAPPITGPNLPLVRPMQSRPQINLAPLLQELVTLRSELASRPQQVITQNIDGGQNPVETGHSAALALRLARR